MFFLRVVSILCGVALLLAACADLSIFGASLVTGSFMIGGTRFGWTTVFSLLWIIALVLGLLIARKFHVFPFIR